MMLVRFATLCFLLAVTVARHGLVSSQEISLGSFTERAHNVNGELFALSERVLEIRNFEYDGLGPAVYFWIDTSPTPTAGGMGLASPWNEPACAMQLTQAADGMETVIVELPEGSSVADFAGGSFSIWCEAFSANFGEVVIPSSLEGLPGASAVDLACSAGGADNEPPAIAMTPEGYNCEPLHEDLQVRWKVVGDNNDALAIELVGRIDDDQYMAFGRSGRDDETFMEGADAVVADISLEGEFRARDLYMGVRGQCSAGEGVCPDGQFGFTNDATDVSGAADFGLTLIRYTRSLGATDVDAEVELQSGGLGAIDRVISLDEDTFIVWAIGPLSASNGFPNFHTIYPGSSGEDKDYSLNFGREVMDNCTPLVGGGGGGETELAEPFERPVLGQGDNVVEFEAHIGLSGGPRGYMAISGGRTAWGISWYLNGYIVPELELRRGTTYRFLVNGGDDPATSSVYHPLYITDSIAGGYAGLTAEERKEETVFAGIDIITETEQGVTEFEPTAVGPICSYTAGDDTMAAFENLSDYDTYFATLDSSCADDMNITSAAGVLEFAPDENTPDLLYYQCVTHQNLGWKINIVNADGTSNADGPSNEDETSGTKAATHIHFGLMALAFVLAIAGL